MPGHRIGYIRVSSQDQNIDRQLDKIHLDKTYVEKASGKDTKRPQLDLLLGYIREGDTLIVHSMDRLARNLDDLRRLVQLLTKKGIRIEFIKENLVFTGEDSPMAMFLLSVMGAFAEFERALIRERQYEGIAIAKKRGAYKGRKHSLTSTQETEVQTKVAAGHKVAKIAKEFKVSRETIYKCIRKSSLQSKKSVDT